MATTLTGSYQYIGRTNAVSCPSGYNYYVLLYAKTSANKDTGKHTVSVLMRLACTSNSTFYGFRTTGSVSVAGTSAISWSNSDNPSVAWSGSSSITVDGVTYKKWIDLGEGSAVVNTGFGVNKTVAVSASWVVNEKYSANWYPYTGKYATADISVVLPMIAGASTITSASDITLGNNCNVKWTPLASNFYYKLIFTFGTFSNTVTGIAPNTTSEYTYTGYTPPVSASSQIPDATTGTMTATLYTYTDSACTNQVGSESSKNFTVTVPNNIDTQPSVDMTLSAESSLPSAFDGLYIKGKTKVKALISALGKYDATIKSCRMSADGKEYDASSNYTSEYLSNYGTVSVKAYATDSRGYTGIVSEDISVIDYSKPKILPISGETRVVAARCDAEGNIDNSGTYLKIKAKRNYSLVKSDGVQKNFCAIRCRYKLESEDSYSSWLTILAPDSVDSDEIVTEALFGGALSAKNTYLVQIQAIDDIGDYDYTTISVPTEKVYMHKDGIRNSLALGKYVEDDNCIDIAEGISIKIRGEKWVSIGLSPAVEESASNFGRGTDGTGCFYRVVNGNHIYIAFNCKLLYEGSVITVNRDTIPEEYRPKRNVYAICVADGKTLASVVVNNAGNIIVDWIQVLSSSSATTSSTVSWIDGYIDYFI